MSENGGVSVASKACKGCGLHKPLTREFWTPQKLGKHGFTSRCRECKTADNAKARTRPDQKARQQAWRDANKDYAFRYNRAYRAAGYKSTADVKSWRLRNLEHARKVDREKQRRLVAANPEKYREINRRSALKNHDRILRRANERTMRLYYSEPWFNLRTKVSSRVRTMLLGCGGKARRRTEDLLGYRLDELLAHLERQFTPGMTRDKLLAGAIEIDHIIPVRKFKPANSTDPEFMACWALANLRPMWRSENRAKSGKVLTLL